MWRKRIQNLSRDVVFAAPSSPDQLQLVESRLSLAFPRDLHSLLLETNGVLGEYDLGLVWNMQRIEEDNLAFRSDPQFQTLYMPFDCLLFFADAGNGDQFAFTILDGAIRRPDIFVWDHENDSRSWVAPSLDKYLQWWLDGTLKL